MKQSRLIFSLFFLGFVLLFPVFLSAQIVFEKTECYNNGTLGLVADDHILFDMNPPAPVAYVELPYTYTVTATIAGIAVSVNTREGLPAVGILYGRTRSFKLAAGSCGKGDVIITVSPDWGAYSPIIDTIPSPPICIHYTCDGASGAKSVNYSYRSGYRVTDVTALPTYIPRFDTSGGKVLDSVKINYKAKVVTSFLFENLSPSLADLAVYSEAILDFRLNSSSISSATIYPFVSPGFPAYAYLVNAAVLVPPSGSWLGDVVTSGSFSTLERMEMAPTPPWLSTTILSGLNPLADPRWVTNATGDTTTDDDFYLDLFYKSDSFQNSNTYTSAAIELNQFIGTGNIPFDYSSDNFSNVLSSGGSAVSKQATQTEFSVELSYFFTIPCYSISGTIFHDPNGANVNNSTGVPNLIDTGIYAYLLDQDSLIIAIDTVLADGQFSFEGQQAGNYRVIISTQKADICTFPPLSTLPLGWNHTGAFNGLPNSGNSGNRNGLSNRFTLFNTNISNINFGIQQPPITQPRHYTIGSPMVDEVRVLNGTAGELEPLEGNDPTEGVLSSGASFVITTLPLDGELWYMGAKIDTPNFVIPNYNPDSLGIKFAGTGYTSTEFYYASMDSAGAMDQNPAQYAIEWFIALPIDFLSINVNSQDCIYHLDWEYNPNSINELADFEVEKSMDGINFYVAHKITPKAKNSFVDEQRSSRVFYRIVANKLNGARVYSKTLTSTALNCSRLPIKTYPNPTSNELNIELEGSFRNSSYQLIDALGKTILQGTLQSNSNNKLDVSGIAQGVYVLKVIVDGNSSIQPVQIGR